MEMVRNRELSLIKAVMGAKHDKKILLKVINKFKCDQIID
jgi:hypothetical protein